MKGNKIIRFILGFIILVFIGFMIFFGINLFSKPETLALAMKTTCEITAENKNDTVLEKQRIGFAISVENKNEIICKCLGITFFLLAFLIIFFLFSDLLNESIKFSKIDLLSKEYKKTLKKLKTHTQTNVCINVHIDKEFKTEHLDKIKEIITSNYKDYTDLYKYYANAITEV